MLNAPYNSVLNIWAILNALNKISLEMIFHSCAPAVHRQLLGLDGEPRQRVNRKNFFRTWHHYRWIRIHRVLSRHYQGISRVNFDIVSCFKGKRSGNIKNPFARFSNSCALCQIHASSVGALNVALNQLSTTLIDPTHCGWRDAIVWKIVQLVKPFELGSTQPVRSSWVADEKIPLDRKRRHCPVETLRPIYNEGGARDEAR